ncbi:MAG: hypothetical protein PF487_08350 [Bacteroidales bacterium]|jgi:hypothetical protein|nr:hypothetical protein [Bacteroidales bacterium]
MRNNNLTPNNGLSLSQAQSVSNLCNQRAIEITSELLGVNNFSKTVKVDGEDKILIKGQQLPKNVAELLTKKAKLHACQAFLMENIKAKDNMLNAARNEQAGVSSIEFPEKPKYVNPVDGSLANVNETFGWSKLIAAEYNEYLEAEAFAAHIGQFIHKDGILTRLRNELPHIPSIDWMTIKDGEKTPVTINVHHDTKDLLKLHEDLATIHREKEQRVNYFKAKVKNITTEESARIAKHNADVQNEAEKFNNDLASAYETELRKANEKVNSIRSEFEKTRQKNIKEIASMRIRVDVRFQETINEFLIKLPDNEE